MSDLQKKTQERLRTIKAPIPTIAEAEDFEESLYPPGLGRLLQGAAPPAQLSKQPVSCYSGKPVWSNAWPEATGTA